MSKTILTSNSVVTLAQDLGLEVQEQSGFYKIARDRKAVYVAKSKGSLARIDFAGFELDHPAVEVVTEEDAKVKKLGKVRGQLFPKTVGDDDKVLDAVMKALEILTNGSNGFKFAKKSEAATASSTSSSESTEETVQAVAAGYDDVLV